MSWSSRDAYFLQLKDFEQKVATKKLLWILFRVFLASIGDGRSSILQFFGHFVFFNSSLFTRNLDYVKEWFYLPAAFILLLQGSPTLVNLCAPFIRLFSIEALNPSLIRMRVRELINLFSFLPAYSVSVNFLKSFHLVHKNS